MNKPEFPLMNQGSGNKSLTLIELLITICLFSLLMIAISNIDSYGRYHAVVFDKRVKLQNDATFVLEHISRNMMGTATITSGGSWTGYGGAIGDVNTNPVSLTQISGNNAIVINVDYNNNGKWDGTSTDRQIAYSYSGTPNYQIWYYPPYTGASPGSHTVLTASRIRGDFSATTTNHTYRTYSSADNYVEVQIGTCWTPSSDGTCGTPDNPALDMVNRIYMPSASTN